MRKTRNLFTVVGLSEHCTIVLNKLQFKGLITIPYGTQISDSRIEEAFKNNKSVVCAEKDYTGKYSIQAIRIQVTHGMRDTNNVPGCKIFLDVSDLAEQFEQIANDLGLDIGDHKKNSSGLTGAPSVKDCAYCRYLAGNPADNERTVYTSENFFVIPTIGQFVKGCLLIIPYKHIVSNAELDPALHQEFFEVLEDVEYLIRLTYNRPSVLVWENGTGSGGKGKAKDSIVHSHVHVYPSSITFEDIEQMSKFNFETITFDELPKYTANSYLLIRSQDHKIWKISSNPELYIPRQYIRQLVAEEHGISGDGWNWRTNYFSDNMYDTVEDIIVALRRNWDDLPERIKRNTSFLF